MRNQPRRTGVRGISAGQPPIPVLILFGPTASGKTGILERLFARPRAFLPGEIVSADSMQVYRGMDIGTAKPDAALRAALPHHLIDIRDPSEQFNAGEFVRLADEACQAIAQRGALPVVSGGTGFYLKNFVMGLPDAPPSNEEIRAALKEELASRGAAALAEELAACDPVSAERIHIHDEYRLLRALEVFRLSGRPLSSFSLAGQDSPQAGSGPPSRNGRYRFLIAGLCLDREELYRRINLRCAEMFRRGLAAEVRRLYEAGFRPQDPGMKAIGYKEFFVETAPGKFSLSADTASVEELVARNSRRYAKRQICYFSPIPGVIWISAAEDPASRLRREIEQFL